MSLLSGLMVAAAPYTTIANEGADPEIAEAREGTPPGVALQNPAVATEVAAGQSNISVYGIVTQPGRGFALISVNGKPQDLFRIGSEVMPGARLVAVWPDRVVLDRAGRHEVYRLQGAGRFDVQPIAMASASPNNTNTVQEPSSASGRNVSRYTLSRTAIARDLNSPQQLLSQTVIVPTHNGMLLSEIEPASLIHEWGLQAGDLLLSVNGQILRGPDDLRRSYEQIRNSSQVRLEIERSGKPESLVYHLQ
jgi:general secretion pathway protein C